MRPIEFYTNYRLFLTDFFNYKKKSVPGYSYRVFALKAGIKSPSLFREVATGKRNLTPSTIAAFIRGLGLDERDGRFFENLVLFNQARTDESRQRYLANLRRLRYRKPQRIIPVHLYEYYEKWYNPVIRELAVALPWNGNYAALAKAVVPSIKTSQACQSVELLLRLGFLRRDSNGAFIQSDPDITTGPEVNSLSVRQMNRIFTQIGAEAIDRFPPSERDVSSLVMRIPKSRLPQLKAEIADFRRRIVQIASSGDEKVDCVYGLVIEFFPLARFDAASQGGVSDEQ